MHIKELQLQSWKPECSNNDLKDLQTIKNQIPDKLYPYKEEIRKLRGSYT